MESGVIFLMFTYFSMVGSEIHSLEYIYTALSKPAEVPGVYEFTAMGILDNEQIDYYNSKDKTKIPRQTWMCEELDDNYWDKGTSSRKSKEQWFRVNVEILMNRMNHSKGDLHVLQWRHGCQGEPQPDGKLAFRTGFDQYSYDGGDFLSFDPAYLQWVAPVLQARPTKLKWDNSQTLNQYTEGYLKRECMDWLNKFMGYGQKDLKNQTAPVVYPRAKTAKSPGKVILHCLTTGLHSRDVEIDIYRNNQSMTEADRVNSTGIRPSEFSADGTMAKTYQLKKSIEILESDLDIYSYKVTYRGNVISAGKWDLSTYSHDDENGPSGIAIGVIMVVLVIIGVVLLVVLLLRKKIHGNTDVTCFPGAAKRMQPNGGSNGSSSPGSSSQSMNAGGSNGNPSPHSNTPLLNGDKSDGSSTSDNTVIVIESK